MQLALVPKGRGRVNFNRTNCRLTFNYQFFGILSDQQFFISRDNGYDNFAVRRRDDFLLAKVFPILFKIEFYAEIFHVFASFLAHIPLVFAHTSANCARSFPAIAASSMIRISLDISVIPKTPLSLLRRLTASSNV